MNSDSPVFMKPALVDEIFINEEDKRILYFNPSVPDWITVNEMYRPLFDLFDGTNDTETINNFVDSNYPEEKDVLKPQIKELFASSGIFKGNAKVAERKNFSNAPHHVYLTLTDNCNLKCVYCYAAERDEKENACFETWQRYISDIIDFAGKPTFTFTGGEPLTVPYALDLAAFTKEKGCGNILLTNGTFINEKNARQIADLFYMVKISLDSVDEAVSGELRGKGVAEKAENAFNLLQQRGSNVQILATVSSKTLDSVETFSNHFNQRVQFQPLYSMMGRARKGSDLTITGEEYYDSLVKSGKFKLLHQYHDTILSFRNNPCKRCALANGEISIDSKGNVYPCHLMHYDSLCCGNLNRESMEKIYTGSKMNDLRAVNVDNIPKCKICVFRNICGGGCRARNDIPKTGIRGYHDFCVFEQKGILDALMYSYG